jgi:gamma-polyglutamate biosynthesis protein CapA
VIWAAVVLAVLVAAPADEVTLVFGGDVAFGRVRGSARRSIGGERPLAHVAPLFGGAHFAFVNLESPLCEPPPRAAPPGGPVLLAGPLWAATHLAEVGVDVVSLANNHAMDCGAEGLRGTLQALAAAGVSAVGAVAGSGDPFAPVFLTRGGVKVAWFAATDRRNLGVRTADLRAHVAVATLPALGRSLPPRVAAVRALGAVDLIVVSLHWGAELAPGPSPAARALAHALVDAGADVVVGHHPHVMQPSERRGGGVIFYSLGNLLFDMRAPATRAGALARVRFVRAVGRMDLVSVELLETRADGGHAPRPHP